MNNSDFDIDKLARLTLLDLTDGERAAFSKELPSILDYVGKLAEADTSKVNARNYLSDLKNVFRPDVAVPASEAVHDAVIANFPKKVGEALEVPGVFE